MRQPLVSIIIPIYKIEAYLNDCLDSVVNQTYNNIEIICVNDGSPDGCADIIESYRAKDSRIVHLKQENGGICKARINGLNIAKGEYIYNLDGDDFLELFTIEHIVKKMIEDDSDLVYADYYDYIDGEELKKIATNECNLKIDSGVEYLESQISTFIWGKLMRKSLLYDLKIQSINVNEDIFFLLQILPRCKKVSYLKENLYFYRQNLTSTMNGKLSVISAQWIIHSIERIDLIDSEPLTLKIKDNLMFDNCHMIFRHIKYGDEKNFDNVKYLIHYTFRNFPYSRIKKAHHLKLFIFIVSIKMFPKITMKFLK